MCRQFETFGTEKRFELPVITFCHILQERHYCLLICENKTRYYMEVQNYVREQQMCTVFQ